MNAAAAVSAAETLVSVIVVVPPADAVAPIERAGTFEPESTMLVPFIVAVIPWLEVLALMFDAIAAMSVP